MSKICDSEDKKLYTDLESCKKIIIIIIQVKNKWCLKQKSKLLNYYIIFDYSIFYKTFSKDIEL